MKIIQERAPHLRRKDSVAIMMTDVVIALLPVIVYSFLFYNLYALRNLLISVLVFELCEFVFVLIQNRVPTDGEKHSLSEYLKRGITAYKNHLPVNLLVPLVSGLIYGLISPIDTSNGMLFYLVLISGAVFGSVIGKLVFGGTGNNIFNPAAVGMVFSKICWGSYYVYPDPFAPGSTGKVGSNLLDVSNEFISGATPISVNNINSINSGVFNNPNLTNYSLLDLFLGRIPGVMGEVCKVLILVGLAYLIIRHTIDWRISVSYIASFFVYMVVCGVILWYAGFWLTDTARLNPFYFATYELLSGGLIFGATFMATDPVTSPITGPGRTLFGIILGSLTALMRLFSSSPEGVVYAILIGNMITPMIDYYKWSDNRWTWKKIACMASVFVFTVLVIIWAVTVKVL